MQSHSSAPGSLQAILRRSTPPPALIQLKPKGLKVILQSTLEFLASSHLEATILAKLPRGKVWQEDLLRHCSDPVHPSPLYLFSRPQPGSRTARSPAPDELHRIPLSDPDLWRGEYFFLILGADWAAAITASRIQTQSATPAPAAGGDPTDSEADPPPESGPYLEVCFSINPALMAELLNSIQRQLPQEIMAAPLLPGRRQTLEDLLQAWGGPAAQAPQPAPEVLDQLLAWQLKQQEQLRQASSLYRRQALSASSISSQNEMLLHTLRLKDNFLSTVGQELRTPLATIKTALTLLASPSLKGPQRQRYIDMVSHECDRQSTLISGVLNLLQMETSLGETLPEAVQLGNTVPPIVSTYQPLAQEKGIMLAYTIPENLPPVACPENWLRQIVIHLLHNSIKYTEPGGEVWVTAREDNDAVELEIRDTGVGIAPGDLPKIFDHFYRGRNLPSQETEGAGLGLSIVQQLLMYCGGTVVVNSQPGSGSSFRVRLPLHVP